MKQDVFKNLVQGMVMGIAEIIPGVSGSTLALVMGIYDDFIDLLHNASQFIQMLIKFLLRRTEFKQVRNAFWQINWRFGLLLLVGMGISIAVASSVIDWSIDNFPHYLLAVFTGLILSSILVPWRQIEKVTSKSFVLAIVSGIVVFLILGLRPAAVQENPSLIVLFFGGMVGITGMVLPGVSGSFILLLLGLYEFITGTIRELTSLQFDGQKILGLLVFAMGLVAGFMFSVKLLKVLLSKWRDELMAAITGLMIGSLRVLWPFIDLSVQSEQSHVSLADYPKILPWEMSVSEVAVVIILIVLSAASIQVILQMSKPKQSESDILEEELQV